MADSQNNVVKSWYLENINNGEKIIVPETQSAHDVLDKMAISEKKDWCLKFGILEISDLQTCKIHVSEIIFPDGRTETFFDDSIISDRREHNRTEVTLRVILISGNRIFRTSCANVSMGGLMLKVKPPRDYTHPELKILIEKPDGSKTILLKANFIENSEQQRMRFTEISAGDRVELQSWIDSEKDALASQPLKLVA